MPHSADQRHRKGSGRPSIYDVADLAHVSHQTVSRVLNGHTNVRDVTRERVLQAVRDVGYAPNPVARALASNRTRRIGVIVDEPTYYGPSSTLWGIEAAAREEGYTVSVLPALNLDPQAETPDLRQFQAQGIDALCVVAPRYAHADFRNVDSQTILITAETGTGLFTASVDQYRGALLAVKHLLELGHQRIVHIAGLQDWADGQVRVQAYSDTMAKACHDVPPIIFGDWTSDFGFKIGSSATALGDATAIFVANDQMALGLLHGLHARGVRVPEDISIVGFDDIPEAKHFFPPLTTVRQDFFALGKLAVRSLIARIEGTDVAAPTDFISPELKVRQSTAPLLS